MGADKSLAFPISYFPICSTTKRIFLEWVREVEARGSVVVKALCYKPEGLGFKPR
jgi:hypothetical protein